MLKTIPGFSDTKGPKVTIREPFPAKTSGQVSIQWTSDENAKFQCAVNDLNNAVSCGYGKEGRWVTPLVPDGEHTFYLIATDRLGNSGPTLSRKWSVGKLVISKSRVIDLVL